MDVPVERFDALLRDLVHYDLVTEEGPGQWRLRPAVESRLAQLATGQRAGSTPDLRIGVSCMGCHALAVTRLHGGRYLCDDCLARTPEHGGSSPGTAAEGSGGAGAPWPRLPGPRGPGQHTAATGATRTP